MIKTVEQAVEKLNEVSHLGCCFWQRVNLTPESPIQSSHNWLEPQVRYSLADAIRIARSYELEEELEKWRVDAEEILKNPLAVRVGEGGGFEDLRASLAVTVVKIDGLRAMRELDLIDARQKIEGLLVSASPPFEIRMLQERSEAWYRVYELCKELGMKTGQAPTGLGDVLNFIRTKIVAKGAK